jgi:pyruvate, water dikinase
MGRLRDLWQRRRARKAEQQSLEVEELRTAFTARYHEFKLLLNANNKFLGILAEIEEALRGTRPFGMGFVRSSCTQACTCVFQIVRHLNGLAGGKYEALLPRFKEIQEELNSLIREKEGRREGPLVLSMSEVDARMAEQVGGKIANLGEVGNRIHLDVPAGFAITSEAYRRFIEHNDLQTEIDRRIQSTEAEGLADVYSLSADIQGLITRAEIPAELRDAILQQCRVLDEGGKNPRLAMRSSALGEDAGGTSFAGQYRSELNVSGENILQAYKEVVAGKYSVPAMTYRLNRGIRDEDVPMCVACLRMVDAVAGGVLYTRNPVNIRDEAIIVNSVWGLPKGVVDGGSSVDLFTVSREDPMRITRREVPVKELKLLCDENEGIRRSELSVEEGQQPSLRDDQILELARLALQIEAYYRSPQDIEWAIDDAGKIIVLQCRPLMQVSVPSVAKERADRSASLGPVLLTGGVTASPGVAAGPVFKVRKDVDGLQFPEGAVLITAQALPRWATLLSRARAVVSETGSVAGHLANVAREFRVPAVFGVTGAMERLEDGQEVTVDADAVSVLAGRIEALLAETEGPKNLMQGSPVFRTFESASRLIAPLNLLDPDAPAFKPANCKTLHDITRFSHEKAVHEMFQFGKEHHFSERSSKQLYCDVAMQWWVLNLDDGFKEEVEGKYVGIDNIASIPMLAIWDGITCIPWEGPPAMDGKGMMSVMFEATRNPALTPGLRSRYTDRNYFMISKNYCSLASRLGFHFSLIEALVGDRPIENYIGFQYKGGAADFDRRLRRILLTKELLEECDFRVEVTEDSLIARVEEREKDFMILRLKILGYLTIHTRQIDMIMANPAAVARHKAKMQKDIQGILAAAQQGGESSPTPDTSEG